MPPFDLDLTNPTPAAVEAAMVDAVNTANFGEFDFSPKCLQVTLAPGASCTMSMRFWPTQAGPVTGWLTIRAGTKN